MAALQPDVKTLLKDVLALLHDLEQSSAAKPLRLRADGLRQRIEQLCPEPEAQEDEDFYDEAGVEHPEPSKEEVGTDATVAVAGPVTSKGSVKRKSSSGSWNSGAPVISDVVATSFDCPTRQGHLEKKRPEGTLTRMLSNYQKRYCVISNGIFYYFDSTTAKKQSGAFCLKDYEARPAYHLIKSITKKEGSFELVAPGQRSYQFLAKDFEELKGWISAVSEWSDIKHPPISSLSKPSDAIDKNAGTPSGSDSGSIGQNTAVEDDQADYVEPDTPLAKQPSLRARRPPPTVPEEETYDEATGGPADVEEETYDEADMQTDQETYDEAAVAPAPTRKLATPPVEEILYDELSQGEDEYDEAGVAPSLTPKPPVKVPSPAMSSRPVPALPVPEITAHRPLPPPPPPPPPPERKVISVRSDDYGNMFYGLWDCETNVGHELPFSSGDIIHVVDRENDGAGWWTGVLNGHVGLVPKNYLTPVYAAC